MGSDDEPGDALSQLTRLFAERAAATGAVPVPEQPVAPEPSAPVAPVRAPLPEAPVQEAPLPASPAPSFPLPPPATAFPSATPVIPPASAFAAAPDPAPAFGGAPIAARREPAPSAPAHVAPSFAPSPVSAAAAPPAPSVLPRPEPAAPPVSAAAMLAAPPVSAPVSSFGAPAYPPSPAVEPPAPARASVAPPSAAAAASGPFAPRGPLLPPAGPVDEVDEEELARSSTGVRIALILAILLPPIGLVVAIVAAARSASRRGWVVGVVRAAVAVGIVMSVVAAGGAYAGYKVIRQQQAHDRTVAASAPFCTALKKDPALTAADGGWPSPAASVPASVAAMQAFVDRWNALAKIAPEGVRQGVAGVAAAGTDVIGSVQVSHTLDDAQNRQSLQSAVAASGVAEWRAEYCG
jgi:hypothetical protein